MRVLLLANEGPPTILDDPPLCSLWSALVRLVRRGCLPRASIVVIETTCIFYRVYTEAKFARKGKFERSINSENQTSRDPRRILKVKPNTREKIASRDFNARFRRIRSIRNTSKPNAPAIRRTCLSPSTYLRPSIYLFESTRTFSTSLSLSVNSEKQRIFLPIPGRTMYASNLSGGHRVSRSFFTPSIVLPASRRPF